MTGEKSVPALVSVVVTVRDNAAHLPRLLMALLKQDYRGPVELVAVDTHNELVLNRLSLAGSRLPVHVMHEPDAGLSRARNTGIRVATGAVVLITDPAARPSPGWVRTMATALTHGGADLVCGQVSVTVTDPPGARLAKALLDLVGSASWPTVPCELERPWQVSGCNLGFRNGVVPLQFDEERPGADRGHRRCGATELAARLLAEGRFVQAVPDAVVHRDVMPADLTMRAVCARAWWKGGVLARLAHERPQSREPVPACRLPDGYRVRWAFTRGGRLAGAACLASSASRRLEQLRLRATPRRKSRTAVAAHG
ncbi:glycosyltransferase family 2 protein [Streptomyces olivoreticuli]|uniref:glycosyltransferase family 2 protein n=1 Tax=Streptomyces olivoreticuli TaxID=68246 RepID=UPI000E240AE2|nr:glycosyltransferase [Streptomyces olivoreticuli]